jgi:hypothetical protein
MRETSKTNVLHPYVIYLCTCKSTAKVKAVEQGSGEWHLFFNRGGKDSSNTPTATMPILLTAHKECLDVTRRKTKKKAQRNIIQ